MTYVMADIHGEYEKFTRLLDRIGFSERDTLYVLGDVIDRGRGGVEVLRDMMARPNVIPIIGNHESLALTTFKAILCGKPPEVFKRSRSYRIWKECGGAVTARAFAALDRERQRQIVSYVESFSVYRELTVAGQAFHLSHTLPPYDPSRDIHEVTVTEFVWGEPDYGKRYDEHTVFITGHTPTGLLDPAFAGRIWRGNGHLAIDCGAPFEGGRLGCICLETMEEYYD